MHDYDLGVAPKVLGVEGEEMAHPMSPHDGDQTRIVNLSPADSSRYNKFNPVR